MSDEIGSVEATVWDADRDAFVSAYRVETAYRELLRRGETQGEGVRLSPGAGEAVYRSRIGDAGVDERMFGRESGLTLEQWREQESRTR